MKKAVSQRTVRRKARFRVPLYGFFSFSLIGSILSSTRGLAPAGMLFMLFITALVVWKLLKWLRALRMATLFPQYVHALESTRSGRTRDLAAALGQSQGKVMRNLRSMARLGLLPEIAITRDGAFALMGADHQPFSEWRDEMRKREEDMAARALLLRQQEEADLARKERIAAMAKGARCSGCGAQVRVTRGRPNPCPYCGTLM